jgi:hypothetical protein
MVSYLPGEKDARPDRSEERVEAVVESYSRIIAQTKSDG